MTIALTGASGRLGQLAIRALQRHVPGNELIGLARNPADIEGWSVTPRAFDYDRPDALAQALAGVATLVLISSPDIDGRVEQHRGVIAAARKVGVERIVYTSLLHADTSTLSLAPSHLATEAALRASGLSHTILRNGWYTENYTPSIPGAVHRGAFIGSSGEGRISAAARTDYAEAIAVVATTHGHAGRTFELAGDDAFTLTDLAAELSRRVGRGIPYHDLPEGIYADELIDDGMPEDVARSLASWEVSASHGALFDDGRQLSTLIERATTTMAQTIAEMIS